MNLKLRKQIENFIPFNEQEEKEKEVILKYMDTFNNLLSRENEFAHFTASCWLVNKNRTKVLMVYHNIYKSWSWIGGHADGNEDLLQVAIKEAKEETAVSATPVIDDIFSLEILGVAAHKKRNQQIATHLHLNITYLLEADEEAITKIKPDENSDVSWFNLEEAVDASNETHMKEVYKKLNKKLHFVK